MPTTINEIHLKPLLLEYFPRMLEGTGLTPETWRLGDANYLVMEERYAVSGLLAEIDAFRKANGLDRWISGRNECREAGEAGRMAAVIALNRTYAGLTPKEVRAGAAVGVFRYMPDEDQGSGHVANCVVYRRGESSRVEIGVIEPQGWDIEGRPVPRYERRLRLSAKERESVRAWHFWM
jgi:hypothetical protein